MTTTLPPTGRASIFAKANEPMTWREFPVSEPGPGEALLKVLRANICGSDVHMFKGEAFGKMPVPYQLILGHEFVGEVVALGKGVSRDALGQPLAPGDRVTLTYYQGCGSCRVCTSGREYACTAAIMSPVTPCDKPPHFVGAFSEYYVARRRQKLFKIPEGVPLEVCAGLNCALSQVMFGLQQIGINYGDRVVIQGAGGLGLYAVAIAKQMGAGKVVAIDGFPQRLDLAKRMGADGTVSLQDAPEAKQRTAAVKGLLGGGADVVVEVVGHANALKEGIRMLERGGRYLIMGAINPQQTVEIDPSMVIGQNLDIRGVSLYPPAALAAALDFVTRHHKTLPLAEMVKVYPFAQINEAMAAAQGRQDACRVQVTME